MSHIDGYVSATTTALRQLSLSPHGSVNAVGSLLDRLPVQTMFAGLFGTMLTRPKKTRVSAELGTLPDFMETKPVPEELEAA